MKTRTVTMEPFPGGLKAGRLVPVLAGQPPAATRGAFYRLAVACIFLALGCAGRTSGRAATITVTSNADSGAGSLRAALAGAADGDTVNVAVSGVITLTSGQLVLARSINLLGPGPTNLAVDGNGTSRVFNVLSGQTVTISGLTIRNGNGNIGQFIGGGGISSEAAMLTVSNVHLIGNSAEHGGAIQSYSGAAGSALLRIVNCTLSGNSANNDGGAVANASFNQQASLQIINTTLTNNTTPGVGGAIYNLSVSNTTSVEIIASTLNGNSAGSGAGIFNVGYWGSANLQIANSTLSSNSASFGGAIYNSGDTGGSASLRVVNSTLSGNLATNYVGGILNSSIGGSATVVIGSTILQAGASGANLYNYYYPGTVNSLGYNLSSDDGGGFLTEATDQRNSDPKLGPLQDNGGPTPTHALLYCSPAIDGGKNFSGASTDQRGLARTFDDAVVNLAGGDGSDIGAFEMQQPFPQCNHPPIADASATVRSVHSTNGFNAHVILDGSRSFDRDGDIRQYNWLEPLDGGLVATGAVAEAVLTVGQHSILLVVSDAQSSATNAITIEVIGRYSYITNNGTITITRYNGPGSVAIIPDILSGLPVTSIRGGAFEGWTNLTAVTIPETVANIEWRAFAGCSSLTNVTLPNNVTNLGPYVFAGCTRLASISIGNGVASIPDGAFSGCSGLLGITIPNTVTRIGGEAFAGCTSLTRVIIPAGVISLGYEYWDPEFDGDCAAAFADCTNLKSVFFEGNAPSIVSCGELEGCDHATVYYIAGMTGWGPTFAGRPTALWLPTLEASEPGFGVPANRFGFDISWARDRVIIVEATTNLIQPAWIPLGTNTLVGGSATFSDSQWTNYPTRVYRARTQ